jgi:hypothetical protein
VEGWGYCLLRLSYIVQSGIAGRSRERFVDTFSDDRSRCPLWGRSTQIKHSVFKGVLADCLRQGFSTGVPRDVARGSARDRD